VVTYEDLVEKRAKRAVTDAKEAEEKAKKAKKTAREARNVASAAPEAEGAAVGMKKRGRKRKSATLEQEVRNPAQGAKVPRTSKTQIKEIKTIPQPYKAPEAKMY
jgi:hypothetical protein